MMFVRRVAFARLHCGHRASSDRRSAAAFMLAVFFPPPSAPLASLLRPIRLPPNDRGAEGAARNGARRFFTGHTKTN